jgi:hypothetical protein
MAPERPPLAAETFGGLLQEQLGGHTTVQAILSPIMWLGVAGFVASALVHVFALAGVPSPFGSATWVLHIGIFVVVANDSHCSAPRKEFQTGGILESRVSRLPPWVKSGAYVLGGYAVLNFILFAVQTGRYAKNEVPDLVNYRGFSGHWMVFYYVGAATLYSAIRLGDLNQPRCPHGHDVSLFAKYCDVCGIELSTPSHR